MNYRNGIPTDVRVAKDASVRKYVTEGRYNVMFMTYDELQKIWKSRGGRFHEDSREQDQ